MSAVAFKLDQSHAHIRQDRTCDYSNLLHSGPLHSVCPPSPQQHGVESDVKRSEGFPRNIDAQRTEIETRLVAAFTVAAPQYQVVAKSFGPAIGASPATIESYRQRFPQAAVNVVMLGRRLPAFGLELMDMMGIDIDQDRAAFAKFLEIHRAMNGRG